MRRRALLAALGGLLLSVIVVNAVVLAGGREQELDGQLDCALVLGAGVAEDGTPSPVLHERLEEGLALYRTGRVGRLIVSGDHHVANYDEPNAMRRWLEAHDVPSSAIFMDHAGVDTYS